jgi:hypothetical protein
VPSRHPLWALPFISHAHLHSISPHPCGAPPFIGAPILTMARYTYDVTMAQVLPFMDVCALLLAELKL